MASAVAVDVCGVAGLRRLAKSAARAVECAMEEGVEDLLVGEAVSAAWDSDNCEDEEGGGLRARIILVVCVER